MADVPFFLVTIDPNSRATVRLLKDWEACQSNAHKVSYFTLTLVIIIKGLIELLVVLV